MISGAITSNVSMVYNSANTVVYNALPCFINSDLNNTSSTVVGSISNDLMNQVIYTNFTTYNIVVQSKEELFRNRIRNQLLPSVVNKRCGIKHSGESELRARALLREMISPKEYLKYLKTGFLTVFGRSGMVYRISGLYEKIRCYVRNKDGGFEALEDLCIVFDGEFSNLPYTDWVIMRKILIENDEFGMRKIAISSKIICEVPQVAMVG